MTHDDRNCKLPGETTKSHNSGRDNGSQERKSDQEAVGDLEASVRVDVEARALVPGATNG